ncbi:MAG TPA: type II secretion system minor pseudopilin GspK [Pseudomonas sp.]|nr:type II secretion system minor pseudopilin GspK [Pseudomonas sp.]
MRAQRGVALITVLLVVALVTVVGAGLIARQQLAIRSSGNLLTHNQAWHYALGGELLAKAILREDLRQGDPRQPLDHPAEPWAQPMKPFPFDDGGTLYLRIEDAGGRFNLNALALPDNAGLQAFGQFQRLLRLLDIDEPYAERLRDWLDEDEQATPGGAEDNDYLLLDPAYRAANRALAEVSELRLLLDMNEAHYRHLLPHVTALPLDARLNLNSAGPLVLASLVDGLSPQLAQGLIVAREAQGFASVEAFITQLGAAGQTVVGQPLAVGSQYFRVIGEVELAGRRQVLVSLVRRDSDGALTVLSRDLGQAGINKEQDDDA